MELTKYTHACVRTRPRGPLSRAIDQGVPSELDSA